MVEVDDGEGELGRDEWDADAPEQAGGDVGVEFIDEVGVEEGGMDGGPAFDDEGLDVALAEGLEQLSEFEAALGALKFEEGDAALEEGLAPCGRGIGGSSDDDGCGWLEDARGGVGAAACVEDDADGLAGGGLAVGAGGERWVVGEDGAAADEDGVDSGAVAVGASDGGFAGEPGDSGGGGADGSIEADGDFGDDVGDSELSPFEVGAEEVDDGLCTVADFDFDAGVSEALDAFSADVRVEQGDDDAPDAGGDDGFGAGGRALAREGDAGFEGAVEGGAAGVGRCEGGGFGVRAAVGCGGSVGDDAPVADEDGADPGVG